MDENNDLLIDNLINASLKQKEELISLLIKEEDLLKHFFESIDEVYIFNYNKFNDYIDKKRSFNNSYTKFKNKIGLSINNKYMREKRGGVVSLAL